MKYPTKSLPLLLCTLMICGCQPAPLPAPPVISIPNPTPPAVGTGRRRATAIEILTAAQTGVVPTWFDVGETEAVDKLNR